MTSEQANPVGLDGMEFIEFTGNNVKHLEQVFDQLGLVLVAKHKTRDLRLYRSVDINFLLNNESNSFASEFRKEHGPSVCSTGFRVKDAKKAFETAVARGAKPYTGDAHSKSGWKMPAIYGIGDSLVYFVDQYGPKGEIYNDEFEWLMPEGSARRPNPKGVTLIDHMTNNVPRGEMQKWCDFYEKVFNFKERRYFDIKGKSTGLISKVMRSPCGRICIPINEPTDPKSQIQEYLDEYKGSGIQHIALLTDNIVECVSSLRNAGIEFLSAPPTTYYEALPDRLPTMKENLKTLQNFAILADGDREGYLLQIFTKNQCGPIFVEIIQRRNHEGFGEGNFQALFDAIEADQRARGVL